MSHEHTESETASGQGVPATPAGHGASLGAGDAALGLVAAIEAQLADLRALAGEQKKRTVEHASMQVELQRQATELADGQAQLQSAEATVGTLQAELIEARKVLSQHELEDAAVRRTLAQSETELAGRQTQLQSAEATVGTLQAELIEAQQVLAEHQLEGAAVRHTLAKHETELAERQAQLQSAEATVGTLQAELIEARKVLAQHKSEDEAVRQTLAQNETELSEARQALSQRETEVADHAASCTAQAQEIATLERGLASARDDAQLLAMELEELAATLAAATTNAQGREAEMQAALTEGESRRIELEAELAKLSQLASEAAAAAAGRERALIEQQAALHTAMDATDTQYRDATQDADNQRTTAAELLHKLTSFEQQLSDTRQHLADSRQQLAEAQAAEGALAEQRAREAEELASAQQAMAVTEQTMAAAAQASTMVLEQARAAHQRVVAELQGTVDTLRADILRLESQLETASGLAADVRAKGGQSEAEHAAGQARLQEANAALASKQEELTAAREHLEAIRAQATAQMESFDRQMAAKLAQAQREHETALADALAASLATTSLQASDASTQATCDAAKLGALQHNVEDLQRELIATQAMLDQREEALRVLAQRLLNGEERTVQAGAELDGLSREVRTLREENARLSDELSAAVAAASEAKVHKRSSNLAPEFVDDFNAHRRKRLVAMRTALSVQMRKLFAAKSAIERKSQQCEEVLAARKALSETSQRVESERKRLERLAARNKSAQFVFFCLASLVVISALAWQIGGQLVPATYAVRASLKAEVVGREMRADEVAEWTSSHQKLVSDPEVLALAASRFAQRGMAALGTAAQLKQRFDADLTVLPEAAGRLTMELRGQGKERTQRELETFILAIAASANGSKESRGDGAATAIDESPKASGEPISDPRLQTVLIIGGIGAALASLGLFAAYRMMVSGKQRFEHDLKIAENAA